MVLDDLTVVDCCWLLPGQFTAMMLADLGARVIKIELPGTGDYARSFGARGFASVNRGKEGLTLDLRKPGAQEVMHRLAANADVVMEGFRPGVMARLGADYDTLRRFRPDLIYCSLSGFGHTGPHRDRAGHGMNYAAIAGLQYMAGDSLGLAPILGDLAGSVYATISILAALRERDRHGVGQFIDLSITDAVYGLLTEPLAEGRGRTADSARPGTVGVFEGSDGKLIMIGAVEDHFFAALAKTIGHEEWLMNERYATYDARSKHGHELREQVTAALRTREAAHWVTVLTEAGCPCSPVNDLSEAMRDDHAIVRELVTYVDQPGVGEVAHVRFPAVFSDLEYRRSGIAPAVGEHTNSILGELGYDKGQIDTMRMDGAV